MLSTCNKCLGEGKVISDPCGTCKGKGIVKGLKQVRVNIPAGNNHFNLIMNLIIQVLTMEVR